MKNTYSYSWRKIPIFTLISSMKLFFILDLEKVRWTYYLLKMSHFVGGIRNKGRLVVQHRGTSFFMSWWMTLKRKVLSFYFYVWFFDVYFGYFLLFFGLSVNVDNRLFIHSTFKHLSRSKDFFLIRYNISIYLYTWIKFSKIKHLRVWVKRGTCLI